MTNNLSYRASILQSLLARRTTGIYVSQGLTSHQWKVMSVLYSWPPMPAARITELVTLDKAAISRAVAGLLKLKLADKRLDAPSGVIDVILTDAGRAMYKAMAIEMNKIQQQLFAKVGAEEKAMFFATIDKLEEALRSAQAPVASPPVAPAPKKKAAAKKRSA